MKIEPNGDLFSYRATSQSGGGTYLVDLLANEGVGCCDCPNFRFRVAIRIAKGLKGSCKHILAARLKLAEDIIERAVQTNTALETKSDRALAPTEYEQSAALFKGLFPRCGVCGTNPVDDIHHSRGRLGSLLNDSRFWVPVCRTCHDWIGSNPAAARELTWNGVPVLCGKGEWNSPPAE